MAKDGLQILGDKQLAWNLRALPQKVKKKVVGKAMKAGAAVVAKAARQLAPVETGLLKRAIRAKATRNGNGKVYVAGNVAADTPYGFRRPAKYAHLVEFGTRHSAAKPFIRPAMEAKRSAAFDAVAAKARQEFEKL